MTPLSLLATDDDGPDEKGTPWWLRAIYKLGASTVIALFLVWFISDRVETRLTAMQLQHDSLAAQMSQHVADMAQQQLAVRWLLRSICLNTAKNDVQARTCIEMGASR